MPMLSPKTKSAKQLEDEFWLVERGWYATAIGWRHPNLAYPWPTGQAVQLQRAADKDDSLSDAVHRALRGEP